MSLTKLSMVVFMILGFSLPVVADNLSVCWNNIDSQDILLLFKGTIILGGIK